MINLLTYNNSAPANMVYKGGSLSQVGTLTGTLREDTNILYPVIRFKMATSETVPSFNYAYIVELKRYYYVTDVVYVADCIWEISLAIDVLMTYFKGIRALDAFVDRNEADYDNLLVDNKQVFGAGETVIVSAFTPVDNVFANNGEYLPNGVFVLDGYCITGGST